LLPRRSALSLWYVRQFDGIRKDSSFYGEENAEEEEEGPGDEDEHKGKGKQQVGHKSRNSVSFRANLTNDW
jgi:hypothetical protein